MKMLKGVARDLWYIANEVRLGKVYDAVHSRFVRKQFELLPSSRVFIGLDAVDHMDWGLKSGGVAEVWKLTQGEGIKVAILDTGASPNHPDLKGAIVAAVDFTSDRNPVDVNGHGTHVAGIIGARGIGVSGVAPKCSLYCAKVLSNSGSGDFDWIVNGIEWAIQQKVDIINMSLGSPIPYEPLRSSLEKAQKQGIIIIAAAGNSGYVVGRNTIGYPARYMETIAVGSVDPSMGRSQFSSTGAELDIMAPGGRIYSTWPPDQYTVLQGTSMAAPYVAGVCALILSLHRKDPSLPAITSTLDMLEYLKRISIDSDGKWDAITGWGIVDPEKMLTVK